MMRSEKMGPIQPWWRVRMVWLVFGLPAVVVVASFITLGVAIHGGDTPLSHAAAADSTPAIPAMQARNHAATARR
jgi:hypothetical protein